MVGGLYGHMNIDHFMIQDNNQIDMQLITGNVEPANRPRQSNDFSIQSSAAYLTELRYGWSSLPDNVEAKNTDALNGVRLNNHKNKDSKKKKKKDKKKGRKSKHDKFLDKIGGPWAERYSATLVSASVVPNYFPTLRVFEYNITEALELPKSIQDNTERHTSPRSKKHKSVKPHPPSKSQPPGPAYSPQTFSWLSYTQYFANLTRINAGFAFPRRSKNARFTYEVEYDTKNDAVFGLQDLTVRSFVDLAARIGAYKPKKADLLSTTRDEVEDDFSATKRKKHKKNRKHKKRKIMNKTWFTFVNRAYVGTKDEEDLHDQFGFAVED